MIEKQKLPRLINNIVQDQPAVDIHTHLFAPAFGKLLLWGIDELLTYHYLVAEAFRHSSITYNEFWAKSKPDQADLIWKTLFIDNSPLSEACRGVITTLKLLGLDLSVRNLKEYRDYFDSLSVNEFVGKAFELANIKSVVMTNDPFDPIERRIWSTHQADDDRFQAALRIDPLLNNYPSSGIETLLSLGYEVDGDHSRSLSRQSCREICRFMEDWIELMEPKYML